MTASFDEAVNYDANACGHPREMDVSGGDTPGGVIDRMCPDCGHRWSLWAGEQQPTASLASPVRYRRVEEPETVATVDGRIEAQPGEYVVEHAGRGQRRVMPGWAFEMLYWPDRDGLS